MTKYHKQFHIHMHIPLYPVYYSVANQAWYLPEISNMTIWFDPKVPIWFDPKIPLWFDPKVPIWFDPKVPLWLTRRSQYNWPEGPNMSIVISEARPSHMLFNLMIHVLSIPHVKHIHFLSTAYPYYIPSNNSNTIDKHISCTNHISKSFYTINIK